MLKIQEIRELIKLIDQSDINEFTYESDGTTVTMKKSGNEAVIQKEVLTNVPNEPTTLVNTTPQPAVKEDTVRAESPAAKEEQREAASDADYEIVSPMVGTFYNSPNPESDPYVIKGSKVQKDTVVCIVEAMKLFNEIEAEVTGEIVEVLVENGELVEYGQPLFKVKTK
ncbi:acetyl-CoA carboxylase biotin carboxyl carrier protein [Oceanobacillus salinisoli]|uniref:acetyl-CoA carboxylase biotin carboxyl carrier protein n=1 Tax=Oceanobacillus salinisoli TaxID=2678611 RepID=UPI0012E0E906|nr:acetyl-CoA carboxylase biotin carboxyl carrier protein [Oceanobacillus salinisoli]